MGRYDNVERVYNSNLDMKVKNFIDKSFIEQLIDGSESIIIIPDGFQYRPDKLANYYYGDSTLYWIFYYVNGLDKGIEDFYVGREIIIPSVKTVSELIG